MTLLTIHYGHAFCLRARRKYCRPTSRVPQPQESFCWLNQFLGFSNHRQLDKLGSEFLALTFYCLIIFNMNISFHADSATPFPFTIKNITQATFTPLRPSRTAYLEDSPGKARRSKSQGRKKYFEVVSSQSAKSVSKHHANQPVRHCSQATLTRSASCKEKRSYPHLKSLTTTRVSTETHGQAFADLGNTLNKQLTLKLGNHLKLGTVPNCHHYQGTSLATVIKHPPVLRINQGSIPSRINLIPTQQRLDTPPKKVSPLQESVIEPHKPPQPLLSRSVASSSQQINSVCDHENDAFKTPSSKSSTYEQQKPFGETAKALHANSERKSLLTARINHTIAAIEQKAEALVRAHSQPAIPPTPRQSTPRVQTVPPEATLSPSAPLANISKSLANSRQQEPVVFKTTATNPNTPSRRPKAQPSRRPKNWLGKENTPVMDLTRLRETILNRIFL